MLYEGKRITKDYSLAPGASVTENLLVELDLSDKAISRLEFENAGADISVTFNINGETATNTTYDVVSNYGVPCRCEVSVTIQNASATDTENVTIVVKCVDIY